MLATGKPVVVFLYNGRPLSINHLAQNVPVIFECWYLGQENGHAVAEVLFGDVSPSGKLPITIPRSAGHLPVFYNYKPSARRGYLFDDVTPLYAFGYGLSYTTFAIKNVRLEKEKIRTTGSTRVVADVTKTVSFEIAPELLAFYDVNMKYVVEPGDFTIMIGNSSRDSDLVKLTLKVTA